MQIWMPAVSVCTYNPSISVRPALLARYTTTTNSPVAPNWIKIDMVNLHWRWFWMRIGKSTFNSFIFINNLSTLLGRRHFVSIVAVRYSKCQIKMVNKFAVLFTQHILSSVATTCVMWILIHFHHKVATENFLNFTYSRVFKHGVSLIPRINSKISIEFSNLISK